MPEYSNEEYADMHLMYGQAHGNACLAQRMYREQFPRRRCPSSKLFIKIDRRLRETGSFNTASIDAGKPRHVRTPAMEEDVLNIFKDNPSTSTRAAASEVGVSHQSVWRVLRAENMHPFHVQRVQLLSVTDCAQRTEFVRWLLNVTENNPQFLENILFTDEATFTREGVVNTHNMHTWSYTNPHTVFPSNAQQKFSVNIWAGVLGDYLIGPYLLPDVLNGSTYLVFLRDILPQLLQNVPATLRHNMWFMHDGAPAHFFIGVRNHLNSTYPGKWIGRSGPVAWPARSPDLNPLDFFVWGHLKSLVYETPVDTPEDLPIMIILM